MSAALYYRRRASGHWQPARLTRSLPVTVRRCLRGRRLTVTAGRGTGPGGGSLRLSSTQPGFKLPAASHSDRDSCATPGATHRWQAAGSLGDSEALRLGPGLGLGPADSELQVTLPGTSSLRLEVTRLPLPACDSPELTTQ